MRGRAHFTFTKWYLDCVDSDGRAIIGYWASLDWRGVALTWQNVTLFEADRAPVSRSSLASSPPPVIADGSITWDAPALECHATIRARQRPIDERLLETDAGTVEWRVEAPAAEVSFKLDGSAAVQGVGYAERISLDIPPWRLPIRELRWGHWIDPAASRSVVWIDWRGESPRTWVFVDGIKATNPVVMDDRIDADGLKLALGQRRTLHSRSFDEVAATIPALRAIAPKSLLALRETKWCGAGTLTEGHAPAQAGYAIHEIAVFR